METEKKRPLTFTEYKNFISKLDKYEINKKDKNTIYVSKSIQ